MLYEKFRKNIFAQYRGKQYIVTTLKCFINLLQIHQ